jgi:uncharacterized peroxidase-related enzyme
MTYLKSLPANSGLMPLFQAYPKFAQPLVEYIEVVMRGESPFSPAERELVAAYVSGLNDCSYCRDVHAQIAVALGIGGSVTTHLFSGSAFQQIDQKMRPVLAFARKLTLSPGKMTSADANEVFAVGWDDRALFGVASVCGLFNLINRLVSGLGIDSSEADKTTEAQHLAAGGYAAQLTQMLSPPV